MKTCPPRRKSDLYESNCAPSKAHQDMETGHARRMCDDRRHCLMHARYDYTDTCGKRLWFDPCPATPKYLVIKFYCKLGGEFHQGVFIVYQFIILNSPTFK